MKDQNNNRWMDLCRQASLESNPAKLLKLVEEINKLLEEREADRSRKIKAAKA